MSLCLDERRENMLHVWDPGEAGGEPPIHNHPFDFISTIIVGEMTNTRYYEDPAGQEYHRFHYSPPNEDARRSDIVRLSGIATTYTAGEQYRQLAHELHDSRQLPGTVTAIQRSFRDITELTVCSSRREQWISGKARPATQDEIKRLTTKALEWFS